MECEPQNIRRDMVSISDLLFKTQSSHTLKVRLYCRTKGAVLKKKLNTELP